jgi:hypothetical protein
MKKPTHTLGDAPIEPEYIEQMRAMGRSIDEVFNGKKRGKDRTVGFILMVFPLDNHAGRANYISNAERKDVVTMMKEQIKRFEGQPEITGHA